MTTTPLISQPQSSPSLRPRYINDVVADLVAVSARVDGLGSSGGVAGGTTGQVLTKTSDADFAIGWADVAGGSTVGVVSVVASGHALELADAGMVVEMDSTSGGIGVGLAVFIPDNVDVAFPIGTVIEVDNVGLGTVTFAVTGVANIQSAAGAVTIGAQFGAASLRKRDTDTWILIGQLS